MRAFLTLAYLVCLDFCKAFVSNFYNTDRGCKENIEISLKISKSRVQCIALDFLIFFIGDQKS